MIKSLLPAWSSQPWLWLAPGPTPLPRSDEHPRALLLHTDGGGFAGAIRCGLPLPLPTESLRHIVIQHLHDAGSATLLEECARILEPGGRLWLFSLNPYSPYRWRWRHSGLRSRGLGHWERQLQVAGLQTVSGGVRYLGPAWATSAVSGAAPARLRAVCLLEVEKRVVGLIPPAAIPAWRARVAQAGTGMASWPHRRQRNPISLRRNSSS